MNKTKQQIEEVIKKNLPERKDGSLKIPQGNPIDGYSSKTEREKGFNQAISQIDTSLIADEVLKVVVEKIRKYYEKFEDNDLNIFESTVLYQTREDILELLNNHN